MRNLTQEQTQNNNQNINGNVSASQVVVTDQVVITDTTTFGELLKILGPVQRAEKTPTPKNLQEEAGTPIVTKEGIKVYKNGYVVYGNGYARTVVWLPSCVSFTYHFNPLKDTEKGYGISEYEALTDDILETLAWPIPITMIAEHLIEANLINRTGSRKGTRDYNSADLGDKDGEKENASEDSYWKDYQWRDGHYGENPETAYIRKEELQEAMDSMTDKQREVFHLYYEYGYRQKEIADMLGISQIGVNHHLGGAIKKIKKLYRR